MNLQLAIYSKTFKNLLKSNFGIDYTKYIISDCTTNKNILQTDSKSEVKLYMDLQNITLNSKYKIKDSFLPELRSYGLTTYLKISLIEKE
jgi:hypothetical protein